MHKSWGWEERSRENILGTASQKCQRERQTSLWLFVKNLQRLCMNSLFLYDPGLADGLWPQGLHFVSSQWHREKLLSAFNPMMQSSLQHDTLRTAFFLPRAHTAIHCLWLRCLQPLKPCKGQCIASRFILLTPSHSYKLKPLSPNFQQRRNSLSMLQDGGLLPYVVPQPPHPIPLSAFAGTQTTSKIMVDIRFCTFCSVERILLVFKD